MILRDIVIEFIKLPSETEWIEFKHNNARPEEIGEWISGLSNSAALLGRSNAYIIWGIDDKTHAILGTSFYPSRTKEGNEELENWLLHNLYPRVDFQIYEEDIDGNHIVVFEISPAPNRPVRFKDTEYIRIGSYSKKLRDYPEKERQLWKRFDRMPFENGIAKERCSSDEILDLIDYPNYFQLIKQPLPDNRQAILERLIAENIIIVCGENRYNITNVGAILFARNLQDYGRLSRKALRVIIYRGNNRVETIKEQMGARGYAIGFEGAIQYINDQLPQNEQIDQALRREVKMYPEIAIRELVANALIHQDFNIIGTGPLVEIFDDRMEITNPGMPLIDPLRFIDEPPRSRNEVLAALMRRMAICEERGSGIDKVIFSVEMFQLPAPDFRVTDLNTIAILYGPRNFAQMSQNERIRACYQHACLQYVSGQPMSNASLRKRLGIKDSNYPMVSRIIGMSIKEQLIKTHSEGGDSKYVPFWA